MKFYMKLKINKLAEIDKILKNAFGNSINLSGADLLGKIRHLS